MRNAKQGDDLNRTTDSNKMEVIVLDDQKSRELRRIRTTGLAVYLYDCKYTRECGHREMRNEQLRNRKNDITQVWGVLQSLISHSKGNENKEDRL